MNPAYIPSKFFYFKAIIHWFQKWLEMNEKKKYFLGWLKVMSFLKHLCDYPNDIDPKLYIYITEMNVYNDYSP